MASENNSLLGLHADLGRLLHNHHELTQQLLPPQLRTPAPSVIEWGFCENTRSLGCDPTGENAVECGASAQFREDLQLYLCDHCYREVR